MQSRFGWHARWAVTTLMSTVCLSPPMYTNAASPSEVQLVVGEPYHIPVSLSKFSDVHISDPAVVTKSRVGQSTSDDSRDVSVFAKHEGDAVVVARLFGVIPWKSVDVHVQPRHMVYVGGQSIGVALHVHGAMVIGYQPEGGYRNPLQPGDVIRKVNGHPIESSSDLRRWLDQSGQTVRVTVHRGSDDEELTVPVHDSPRGHQLGVYVRDKTAGIGTLTFYDPTRHEYGALGHMITDPDTGRPIEGWGSVYDSDVTGIVKGEPGRPGEKRGRFAAGMERIGDIQQNTQFGLFGHMDHIPNHLYRKSEMVVALPSQVHTGPAQILTVLRGHGVEAFAVQIENVARQNQPTTRSLVLHVTDPRLLTDTGGIIQGMSGSPILQDGRLVGAVTHVFMSDATRGYGLFAAWMMTVSSQSAETSLSTSVLSGDIIAV